MDCSEELVDHGAALGLYVGGDGAGAACFVADAVCVSAVRSVEWAATTGARGQLVDGGAERVALAVEGEVHPVAAEVAAFLFGSDLGEESLAWPAVQSGVACAGHRRPPQG